MRAPLARAPPHRRAAAAPSALTLPTPVTTTRAGDRPLLSGGIEAPRSGDAPEQEAQILTAEPEGVRHGALDAARARDVRHAVEHHPGSGSARLAVGGTSPWTSVSTVAIASSAPAAAIACPTRDLFALTSTASGSNSLRSAAASTRSFWGVPVPCALTYPTALGRDPRPIQRLRHRPDAALAVGVRRREMPGVRGEPVTRQLRVAAGTASPGVRFVFEHDESRALAERHAPAIPGERPARRGIEQLERVETHEADPGHGIHAPCERQGHLAGGDQLGRQPERRAARAAGQDHGLLGTGRPVAARNDVGMGERQDTPERRPELRVIDPVALAAPEPGLGLEHAAADAADDHRRRTKLRARQARVQDCLVRGRHCKPVGSRAAR